MDNFDRVVFGKKINKIRKEQKITSEYLSVLCDVNAVFIRQIECGKRLPSLTVLIKICLALRASPSYLLNLDFYKDSLEVLIQCASPMQRKLIQKIVEAVISIEKENFIK